MASTAGAAVPGPYTKTTLKKPHLVVVPGNKQIQAKYSKVPGATKYVVEYSTNKSFKKSKKITTIKRIKTVKGLKLRTTYWVRVTAFTDSGRVRSSAVSARPISSSTGRIPIKVTGAGKNKVRVSWPRLKQGTKIILLGSYDNKALRSKKTRFSIHGVHPSETARIVTVPKSYRKYVGSGTANPVYVQAWTYNGSRKNTSRAAYGLPSPIKAAGSSKDNLSFAAYNVGSIVSTKNTPGYSWAQRRKSVRNAVKHADPSVLAVQETTTAKHTNGKRHYEDLGDLLGPKYRLAYPESSVGTAGQSWRTKGDHIYYQPAKVEVLASGLESPRKIAPNLSIPKDRIFAWAHMRNKANGARFYVVSIHLQTGKAKETQALRLGVIKAIDSYMAEKPGAGSEPIIMLGDFNSDVGRYPNGATTYLISQGFTDAASASKTSGMQYATANTQYWQEDGGYPTKPFKYAYSPTRIDYIFVRNGDGSFKYRNQVILTGDKFDERFRGSDHNLQYAELSIR